MCVTHCNFGERFFVDASRHGDHTGPTRPPIASCHGRCTRPAQCSPGGNGSGDRSADSFPNLSGVRTSDVACTIPAVDPTPVESESEQLKTLCRESIEELRQQVRVLASCRENLRDGRYDKNMANAAAALGRAITGAIAEVRKIESAELKSAADLSPALVMSYLRQLSPDKRNNILRDLERIETGGVLG